MDKPDEVRPMDGNFQLEVNYAYIDNQNNRKSEYFLIDVIDFNNLDDFMKVLEGDKNIMFTIL